MKSQERLPGPRAWRARSIVDIAYQEESIENDILILKLVLNRCIVNNTKFI